MCILTYKLLCGIIFIHDEVHVPVNNPFTGTCTSSWMVRCCRYCHSCVAFTLRWMPLRQFTAQGMGCSGMGFFCPFRWIHLAGHSPERERPAWLVRSGDPPPTQRYIPSAVNVTLLHSLPFMRNVHVPHASPFLACAAIPFEGNDCCLENPPNICYGVSVCFCLCPISNNNNYACPCRWMGGYSPARAPRHEWKWYRTATYTSKYTL